MDYGTAPPGPMIDSAWFPDAQSRAYWSSTSYVGYENKRQGYVWVLYFNDGEEVTDLIWRRCMEGASWNKETCTPAPYSGYTQEVAFALAKAEAVSSKKTGVCLT